MSEKDKEQQAKEIKEFDVNDDLQIFFNDFIKKGVVEREDEIVPGFHVRLKVLNTGELLSAEAIMKITQNIPQDIVQKVRGASILSQSILTINRIPVEKEGLSKEENSKRRTELYRKLLEMPAYVIQKSYELYIEAASDQLKIYSDPKETADKIGNF